MVMVLLLTVVIVVLSQDPYKQFNSLQKFFDQSIATLARDYCPFVGKDGSKYCPFPEFQIPDSDDCSRRDGENGHSTELISYDSVSGEIRFPIIDSDKSRVVSQEYPNMELKYFSASFSKVEEYYDNFVAFDSSKPFRNGMFKNITEMIKFFSDVLIKILTVFSNFLKNFGNGQNANLTVSQKEYVVLSKSVEPKNIVLKDKVKEIIDVYLPTGYDEKMYSKFVEVFGTQVATDCNYGGLIDAQIFVKECLPRLLSQMNIDQDLANEIDRISKESSDRKGDPDYIRKSKVTSTAIYGGDPLKEKFSERIPTFAGDPWVTTCNFIPIYDVIKNPEKKQNLKTHIENYLKEPQRERDRVYEQVNEVKEKLFLKAPMPIVLVSETDFQYTPMNILPSQLAGPYSFQYGAAPRIPFYCECTPMKYCRCQTQSYPGNRGGYMRKGVSDIGKFSYSWKHCWRCGKCLWLSHCCCDHHTIGPSHTYGVIGCEKVFKNSKNEILCSCLDF